MNVEVAQVTALVQSGDVSRLKEITLCSLFDAIEYHVNFFDSRECVPLVCFIVCDQTNGKICKGRGTRE